MPSKEKGPFVFKTRGDTTERFEATQRFGAQAAQIARIRSRHSSPNCPDCGNRDSNSIKTWRNDLSVRRKLQCLNCFGTFYTTEKVVRLEDKQKREEDNRMILAAVDAGGSYKNIAVDFKTTKSRVAGLVRGRRLKKRKRMAEYKHAKG